MIYEQQGNNFLDNIGLDFFKVSSMNDDIQKKEKELALAKNEVHAMSLSYNIVPRHVSFLERYVELLHLPC